MLEVPGVENVSREFSEFFGAGTLRISFSRAGSYSKLAKSIGLDIPHTHIGGDNCFG